MYGFTQACEITLLTNILEMVTKMPDTSRVYAVQWLRSDNWANLRDDIQMDRCLSGCEEVVSNISVSKLFRYHKK